MVDTIENVQDGWKVETRIRMSGKLKGHEYRAYKSPSGLTYFSLKQAQLNGFKGWLDDTVPDRRAKKPKAKAKAASKKPAPDGAGKKKK